MTLNLTELASLNYPNTSERYRFFDFVQKPIEMYVFVDPLCPECWSMEPYLKKLSIEFGRFFTIRPIISNHLRIIDKQKMCMSTKQLNRNLDAKEDRLTYVDNSIAFFPSVALAIKAAELQGNSAGRIFLRKIQENYFLKKENIYDTEILLRCAKESNLDILEFKKDLFSVPAKKAFQGDIKITKEMKVKETPTIVFFNQVIEDEGVKISGLNSYDIYVHILKEMLQRDPLPAEKPPLEDFLEYYGVASIKEISFVYDWTDAETTKAMIKLQLKRKVKRMPGKDDMFWKYVK